MGVDQSGGLVRLVLELPAGEHCESPRVAPLSCPCRLTRRAYGWWDVVP
jgi:hypothetical protein